MYSLEKNPLDQGEKSKFQMVFEVNVPSNTCDAGGLGPGLAELCSGSSFLTFMTILEVFVRAQNKISGICERVVPVEEPDDEYDFVVIGGESLNSIYLHQNELKANKKNVGSRFSREHKVLSFFFTIGKFSRIEK